MTSKLRHTVPVLVFARAPVPGLCKTRLIPRYGPGGAAALHRQLVGKTIRMAMEADCGPVQLWATPWSRHPFFVDLSRTHGLSLHRQHDGDLGRRMSCALEHTLAGGAPAAVLVGTDAANLLAADLRDAADALLRGADAVLQPASDGGFVLIGLRRVAGSSLRGVDWSSGRELRQTHTRLLQRGLRVELLPERWDVDHPLDVLRARRERLL